MKYKTLRVRRCTDDFISTTKWVGRQRTSQCNVPYAVFIIGYSRIQLQLGLVGLPPSRCCVSALSGYKQTSYAGLQQNDAHHHVIKVLSQTCYHFRQVSGCPHSRLVPSNRPPVSSCCRSLTQEPITMQILGHLTDVLVLCIE